MIKDSPTSESWLKLSHVTPHMVRLDIWQHWNLKILHTYIFSCENVELCFNFKNGEFDVENKEHSRRLKICENAEMELFEKELPLTLRVT